MSGHAGGCHCGNIRYLYHSPRAPGEWSVRRCTCSHCVRFGARWTSGPGTVLEITVLYASMLQRYEFGTRTAEFLRCGKCGVLVVATAQADGQRIAVLNVNTLDDAAAMPFVVGDTDFDDEEVGSRLERRARNWIQNVSVHFVNA